VSHVVAYMRRWEHTAKGFDRVRSTLNTDT
jgi:hypothetical protein